MVLRWRSGIYIFLTHQRTHKSLVAAIDHILKVPVNPTTMSVTLRVTPAASRNDGATSTETAACSKYGFHGWKHNAPMTHQNEHCAVGCRHERTRYIPAIEREDNLCQSSNQGLNETDHLPVDLSPCSESTWIRRQVNTEERHTFQRIRRSKLGGALGLDKQPRILLARTRFALRCTLTCSAEHHWFSMLPSWAQQSPKTHRRSRWPSPKTTQIHSKSLFDRSWKVKLICLTLRDRIIIKLIPPCPIKKPSNSLIVVKEIFLGT